MIFKCKNCGGNSIYSPEKKKMYCPYCDSIDSQERRESISEGLETCPECGGTIPIEQFDSASKCPYCDNYIIFDERVEGDYRPKFLIPFQMGKDACKKSLRDRFQKNTFAPADFLSEARLDSMQGVYVPFWFYNYDVNAVFEGTGTKVRSWTSGDMRYTETSYYSVGRDMEITFEKLPADASVKMPDSVMDLMEPYHYQELTDFDPQYLSGFYAEFYNMPAEQVEDRAKTKMTEDAKALLRSSVSGYSSLHADRETAQIMNRNVEYGLLPVWRYIYSYKGEEYPFYVNGETGKIVGTAPLSGTKVLVYSGALWFFLTVIMAAVNGILGLL